MEKIEHKKVTVNGINMHIAEIGSPTKGTILFLHGFPELWYSWRHQLLSLSAAGYRAIAPDLRGYGDTDAPPSSASYTAFHVVGDIVGLLDALGIERVFLVGHDWGAVIVWNFALFRPDRVVALVNLSVNFSPWCPYLKGVKPVEGMRQSLGDDFYIYRFQEPGEAEEEFAAVGTRKLMKGFLTSTDSRPPSIPKGKWGSSQGKTSITDLPPWLTEEDISYFADKFAETGFTGGLNYYRCIDLTWELSAPWEGAQVKVPAKFIVGDQDVTYNFPGAKDYIHNGDFKRSVPLLEDIVVIAGVGHFVNQSRPEEINNHIQQFFDKF